MPDPGELVEFYEQGYSREASEAELYSRWRALGAIGKADHVVSLCSRAGLQPASTLEVGCGDGALLSELRRRGFGGRLAGVEITQAAVAIASQRSELDSISLYDGRHLQAPDESCDLGLLSHVLEHVEDPAALLREVARVCRAVVIEVPLEANLSARRAGKRAHAADVGHLHRLDRRAIREIVESARLAIAGELEDPLPLEVHRFFARTRRARAGAWLKWAVRAVAHRVAPSLARRLFTIHYAALCVPARPNDARAPAHSHAGDALSTSAAERTA